jgi:hypothetical protein
MHLCHSLSQQPREMVECRAKVPVIDNVRVYIHAGSATHVLIDGKAGVVVVDFSMLRSVNPAFAPGLAGTTTAFKAMVVSPGSVSVIAVEHSLELLERETSAHIKFCAVGSHVKLVDSSGSTLYFAFHVGPEDANFDAGHWVSGAAEREITWPSKQVASPPAPRNKAGRFAAKVAGLWWCGTGPEWLVNAGEQPNILPLLPAVHLPLTPYTGRASPRTVHQNEKRPAPAGSSSADGGAARRRLHE